MGILLNDVRGYDGQITKAGTCHCFTCGYTSDLPEFVSNVFGYDDKGMMGYKWIVRNFVSVEVDERKKYKLDLIEFVFIVFGYEDNGMIGHKWIIRNIVCEEVDERKQLKLDMNRNNDVIEQVEYIDDEQLEQYRYIHPYMYSRGLTDTII